MRRSLVGRLAGVQIALACATLLALAALSLSALTVLLRKEQDSLLNAVAAQTADALQREIAEGADVREWFAEDLQEMCPPGIRLLVFDAGGRLLGAAGTGPDLAAPPRAGCTPTDTGWRACSRPSGPFRIVAARSEASDLRTKRLVLLSVAAVALSLTALAVILSRAVARRALAPLSRMTASVSKLAPGTGGRVDAQSGLEEMDLLAQRFNDLLVRVDDALARERRFAAEASHELKTPLTVLRGEIESLLRQGGEVGTAAGRALGAADGLIKLVEALLVLSRAQAAFDRTQLATVNLCDLVREQASRLAATPAWAGRRIDIYAPDEKLVAADERLVGLAISNLLENALKFSSAEAPVRVTVRPADDRVVVAVEDQGPGIPAQVRDLIFEPFFRGGDARAKAPGHGLGLPLARAVARAHGGDLVLDPTTAAGTRFELALPLLPAG